MNPRLWIVVVLVTSSIAVVLTYLGGQREQATGGAVAQGYPPPASPTPTDTPAPTSTPDGNGYLPTPAGMAISETTLSASPYADLLEPLQDALDQDDETAIANYVSGRFMLELGYSTFAGGEPVGTMLDGAGAEEYLDKFFDAGTDGLIQGYFEEGTTSVPCLEILVQPFSGAVSYPTPSGSGSVRQSPPVEFPLDSANWRFCKTQSGTWIWSNWAYGEYYPAVGHLWQRQGASGRYYVIRP